MWHLSPALHGLLLPDEDVAPRERAGAHVVPREQVDHVLALRVDGILVRVQDSGFRARVQG